MALQAPLPRREELTPSLVVATYSASGFGCKTAYMNQFTLTKMARESNYNN